MRLGSVLAALVVAACSGGTWPTALDDGGVCPADVAGPYVACGCGCCGGLEPSVTCLYLSRGDCLQTIIDRDQATAASPGCAAAGCSMPVRFQYCDLL